MAESKARWYLGQGTVRGMSMVLPIFDSHSHNPEEDLVGSSKLWMLETAGVGVERGHLRLDEYTGYRRQSTRIYLRISSPLLAPPWRQHYTRAHVGSCYSAEPAPAASREPFQNRPQECRPWSVPRPSAVTSTS